MKPSLFLFSFIIFTQLNAQQIIPIYSGEQISIRGLSVVDDNTIWVSGTQGKIGLSTDGGKTWNWNQVKGYEKTDFRDIEGFDEHTAVIIGIDSPGVVLKTFNGGQTWKTVYTEHLSGVFMDAMEFWEDGNGMIVGDPIHHIPYILRSSDFGNTWIRYLDHKIANFNEGEAMFASSGTNIRALSKKEAVMITGGKSSRFLLHDKWYELPLMQGQTSTGGNSIAVSKGKLVVVGGDFMKDTITTGNAAISNDGKEWSTPLRPPHGYRSCVEYIEDKTFITCGTSGVDISTDNGETWTLLTKEGYHVVRKAKKGKAIFLAGSKGRIAAVRF